MNKLDAMRVVLNHLCAPHRGGDRVPRHIVDAIANSRALIAELDAISSLLTGESSMLNRESGGLLTCQECLDALNAYVEELVAGRDAAAHYPALHDHLAHCADCREQADLLLDLLRSEAGSAPAPTYMHFDAWLATQRADSPTETDAQPAHPTVTVWQQAGERVHRLVDEIAVVLRRTRATFGELPGRLHSQPAPALAFRSDAPGNAAELIELPHPEANLVVRVRTGPVIDAEGTLILEIGTIAPPQPIANARVTLRDGEGALLEGASTDEQGLAVFDALEVGKYLFRIEYADQTWNFAVSLHTPPSE